MSTRAEHTRGVAGCDVREARVLMVGAGGIGCELLKNLVMCGFKRIEAIDLDTIDYSNLNRQFLFRKQHVDRSKVEVARETVLSFPIGADVEITAHHGNVKVAEFGIDYFARFSIVLNALDNLDARRHVNRLCLAAGVPLVESGTEGYLGQVTVVQKAVSECYECQPKSDNKKTYPICTVRNHPDKPVHCIAWAKELLFKKVFAGEQTDLVDTAEAGAPAAAADGEGAEGGAEGGGAGGEGGAPPHPPPLEMRPAEPAREYAARVFDAVFAADVRRLLAMDSLWKNRRRPTALSLGELVPDLSAVSAESPAIDQQAWSVAESAAAFIGAIVAVFEVRGLRVGQLAAFDKDDDACLDFVTAASNLRAAIFGIPLQSRFKVKEIAGNIIPAIATTNAIIAGYIVVEALKALRAAQTEGAPPLNGCGSAYLCRTLSGKRKDRLLVTSRLHAPDPACFVCGTASVTVALDLGRATAGLLVRDVLRAKLSFHEPNLRDGERLLYECGDLDDDEREVEEAKLEKLLTEPPFLLTDGAMLDVDDQSQSLSCQLIVRHDGAIDPEKHPAGFVVNGAAAAAVAPAAGGAAGGGAGGGATGGGAAGSAAGAVDLDDEIELIEDEDPQTVTPPSAAGKAPASKRRKVAAGGCGAAGAEAAHDTVVLE